MSPTKPAFRWQAREQRRISQVVQCLAEEYPDAECALRHENPYQLLVATILSAQCTDERVNQVTPELFRRYPGARELASASPEELQELIRSTGFFRNKTRNLIAAAQTMCQQFEGQVPGSMEQLLKLPGVARKTANVVLGTAYGIPSGVVVDTHVTRLSRRLGLTEHEDPKKIEQDLMQKIPQEEWIAFAHRLIHHGRRICKAQKPRCPDCVVADLCPYFLFRG